MYYLCDFCCICLCNNKILQQLSTTDNDNITYLSKITSLVPEMINEMSYNVMNDKRLLCKECCDNINTTYKFRQKCLRSKTMMMDYISKLRLVSNVSGKISIRLIDFQLQQNEVCVKTEDENNGAIDALSFINVIKTEPSDENSIDIDYSQIDYKNNFLFNYENSNKKSYSDNTLSTEFQIPADIVHMKSENTNEEVSDNLNLLYDIKTEPNEADYQPIENIYIKTEDNVQNSEDCIVENNDASFDGELKNKNKSKKKPSTKNPNECTICKKTLSHVSGLIKHMRTHTKERPYVCTVCNKTFTQPNVLKEHMRTHTGERPFGCKTCNKKFINSSSLNKHLRIHTGERPYKCETCDKTFIQSVNLRKHMRTHTGERPFACTECSKTFTQSNSLEEHKRTHTGERPYECNLCNRKFTSSSAFHQHLKIHIGERSYK